MVQGEDATVIVDQTFRIVYANDAAAALCGHTVAQMLKLNIRDTYHPDDLPAGEENLRQVSRGQPVRFIRRWRCADRGYITVEVAWQPLGDGRARAVMREVPPTSPG